MSPARRLRAPGPPCAPTPRRRGSCSWSGQVLWLPPGERRRPGAGETRTRRCQASSAQLQLGPRTFPLALPRPCRSLLRGGRWGPTAPGVPRSDRLGTAPGPHPDGGHQPTGATSLRRPTPRWRQGPCSWRRLGQTSLGEHFSALPSSLFPRFPPPLGWLVIRGSASSSLPLLA